MERLKDRTMKRTEAVFPKLNSLIAIGSRPDDNLLERSCRCAPPVKFP